MRVVLVFTALVACASAQIYTVCECALFNSLQMDPDITTVKMPLEYIGGYEVTEDQCDRASGTVNDCMITCQNEFDSQGGASVDVCSRTNGQSPRCTGSQWCEALHNNGITNVQEADGTNALYYRMVECEGSIHQDWQYSFREVSNVGFCCNNGQFSHCTTPCEDSCEANNLCECGVFVASQFNPVLLNGTNPLPLNNIGTTWGPPGQPYCDNWPGPEFGHTCDTSCLTASQFFKNQVALEEPSSRNPGVSSGELYCQILKARWADLWPENGIGPEDLVTFARMPGCNPGDGTTDYLKWNTERRYTCHHQALCCDGNGNRYRCEGGDS